MIEMLLKSLGITPEIAKNYIDDFRKMAQEYQERQKRIEDKIDTIMTLLTEPKKD